MLQSEVGSSESKELFLEILRYSTIELEFNDRSDRKKPMKKKNILLFLIFSAILFTSAFINDFKGETPDLSLAKGDPVFQLSEPMIEKIHDQAFLGYVHQAQSDETREIQIFKVFIKYQSGQKESIQKVIDTLDVENVYFYRYTNLISIQAEAGTLASLLTEESVLSLEPDKINKASGVCN